MSVEQTNIYDIKVNNIKGEEKTLADYKGDVFLIVNVASKCGLTPQYEALEKVYEQYEAKGFEILGFPANNFAGQEPGTDEEIQEFCNVNYNVKFPLFSKISVKGEGQAPALFLPHQRPAYRFRLGRRFRRETRLPRSVGRQSAGRHYLEL